MRRTGGLSEWAEFVTVLTGYLCGLSAENRVTVYFFCLKTEKRLVIKRQKPSVLSLSCTWSCYFNQGKSWKNNWVGLVTSLFPKVPAASEEVKWCSWPQGSTVALPLGQDVLMPCQEHVGDTAWGSLCCVYPLSIWDEEKVLDSRSAHLAHFINSEFIF